MESTNLYTHKIQQRKNSKDESLFSEHSPVPAPLKRQQKARKKAFQPEDSPRSIKHDSPRSIKHDSPRSQYDSPRSHREGDASSVADVETAVGSNNMDDENKSYYEKKQAEDRRRLEEVTIK